MSLRQAALLMGMAVLLWTHPAHANSFNFTVAASDTNPADGNKLSASAQFAFNGTNTLTITLINTEMEELQAALAGAPGEAEGVGAIGFRGQTLASPFAPRPRS